MAASFRNGMELFRIVRNLCKNKHFTTVRYYSIQPPEWMGGKHKELVKSGRFDFPEHSETFEERLEELSEENGEYKRPSHNIGIDYQPRKQDRREYTSVLIRNHRNDAMEKAARHKTLTVPLESVRDEWLMESAPIHCKTIAEHYGIYRDLFNGSSFMPVVNLRIFYDCDDDYVLPVLRGNKILPSMAKQEPHVQFDSSEDSLWTLVLTNPDGHLSDPTAEYVHWMIGNIRASDCLAGDVLINYLPPIPPKGTGFHRLIFVLFEQSQKLDFTKWQKGECHNLTGRTFKIDEFHREYQSSLVPKGLAFFQSQWDHSVRNAYHDVLDMQEPVFEYDHRPPYHPPPLKYPHKQPFDRYFDRYRDKKDLAEEVLRIKLKMISPFHENPKPEKFPLIHLPKNYKPSWLKLRENIMHRRLEQFKDLP